MRFLLIICMAMTINSVALAQTYPSSPTNPSIDDCGTLNQAFYNNYLLPISQQSTQCTKTSKFQIGFTKSCKTGKQVMEAWPNCQPLRCQWQQASDAQAREVKTCQQRALKQLEREQQGAAQAKDFATTLLALEKLKTSYQNSMKFITDPQGYLKAQLEASAYANLFPASASKDLQASNAQTILGYAMDAAKGGTKSAESNEVIRKIRKEALNHLELQMRESLLQLSAVEKAFQDFGSASSEDVGVKGGNFR